ncbi:MAG: YHS domain-containing protein [Proteobacteria bacterium]|nr:YHS domain-containing protein [Pseudomonadota bacterium]
MIKIQFKLIVLLILASSLSLSQAWAKDKIYKSFLSSHAVGGYDAVAYFTEGKPVKGKSDFKTNYMGADWLFNSQENLNAFKSNPEKYAPQYGGYCAWAVSQGYTAKGDPKHWSIVNDKLYLNYNAEIQNKWDKNKANFIVQANKNWPSVLE